jgi:hypothetical protein
LILPLIQPPVRRRGWRYTELITCPADLRDWLARERGRLAIPAEVDTVLVARFVLTRDHVLRVLRAAACLGRLELGPPSWWGQMEPS